MINQNVNENASNAWEQLQALVEAKDLNGIRSFLESIEQDEILLIFTRLSSDAQKTLLTLLSPSEAAEILADVPDEQAVDIVEQLESVEAASILQELETHDQADIIGDLHENDAEAILAEMDPAEAADMRTLATYPDDEAGGLMVTEYVSFIDTETVKDVVEFFRDSDRGDFEFDTHVYITSKRNKLLGEISLRELLFAEHESVLKDIMIEPLSVKLTSKLRELEEFFEINDFYGVPVVDSAQRLLGVARRKDVFQAVAEEISKGQLKSKGIVVGEEVRTMPTITRSRRRLSWLSINIVLNIISASVIALYTDTLSAVIALAVFLPIVSDMSGCSGNQAVAVSMRELALGLVKPFEVFRVWVQEIKVGVINGIVLGILIGLVAYFWKGNPYLGLVVGLALSLNTMVAVSIGGTVPLLLRWCNVDPAVASGPVLTTITDLCGFFLILSIATLMLPLLVSG